jgi:hypothetical protein
VRYLIGELEGLGRALDGPGFWDRQQVWTAVRLLGFSPGPAAVAEDPMVYRLALYNFQCMPEPPQAEIERMFEPANRPPQLRETPREDLIGPAGECRAALKQWVAKTLEDLRRSEEQVVDEVDIPALEALCAAAAVINDPTEARKFHRLGGEYRTTLYRSLNLLHALQKRDGAGPPVDPEGRDRPESARTRTHAAAGPAAEGAAARSRVGRQTADIETPATVCESPNGPEKAGCRETEVPEEHRFEGFTAETAGESRYEPSRQSGAAVDEPSAAVPAGPVGDGPVFREGEAPAEPHVRTACGSDGALPCRGGASSVPWCVPVHRLREGGPASRPGAAGPGPEPGRPPPGAG